MVDLWRNILIRCTKCFSLLIFITGKICMDDDWYEWIWAFFETIISTSFWTLKAGLMRKNLPRTLELAQVVTYLFFAWHSTDETASFLLSHRSLLTHYLIHYNPLLPTQKLLRITSRTLLFLSNSVATYPLCAKL